MVALTRSLATVAILLLTGFAVLAGLSCSVLGMYLLYSAYHLVGVSRGAPFNALRPLAVLLIGLPLGTAPPNRWQALGGLMILFGSVILSARAVGRKPV